MRESYDLSQYKKRQRNAAYNRAQTLLEKRLKQKVESERLTMVIYLTVMGLLYLFALYYYAWPAFVSGRWIVGLLILSMLAFSAFVLWGIISSPGSYYIGRWVSRRSAKEMLDTLQKNWRK